MLFLSMFGEIMPLSHRNACSMEDSLKIWHNVQGQQELSELYRQHQRTLDRVEFFVVYRR